MPLYEWFDQNARNLPFRNTKDPYRIWISEVMLQQTRVAAVTVKYTKFIQRFPDIKTLSSASEDEVLSYWQGLGYYSRGRNILKAAVKIESSYGGRFPENLKDALSLPGIGEYTAAAVLSRSFNLKHAVLDGNVRRVISRLFYPVTDSAVELKKIANDLMQSSPMSAGMHNEAVMELGALICRPGIPQCSICPLQMKCSMSKLGSSMGLQIPPGKKNKSVNVYLDIYIIRDKKKRYLIAKEKDSLFFKNQWFFPSSISYDGPAEGDQTEKNLSAYTGRRNKYTGRLLSHTFRHHITKHKILGRVIYMEQDQKLDNGASAMKVSRECFVSFEDAKYQIVSSVFDKVCTILEKEGIPFF